MSRKWILAVLASVALSAIPLFCCSCESEGDDGGTPKEITGNSGLEVSNRSGDETTVYFDGEFIGRVRGNSVRQWSVPSGSHKVSFDNAERDNSEGVSRTYTFVAGRTLPLWVDWNE